MGYVSGYLALFNSKQSIQIQSGSQASGLLTTGGFVLSGVQIPSAFTGTTITFEMSNAANGTFVPVKSTTSGTTLSYTVSPNEYCSLDPKDFHGIQFLKIKSGSAESSTRTLICALKDLENVDSSAASVSPAKPEITTITASAIGQNSVSSWNFPDSSPGSPQIVDVQIITNSWVSGDYISLYSVAVGNVFFWFEVDGCGCAPPVCGPTFAIQVTTGDSTGMVRDNFVDAVNFSGFFMAQPVGCGDCYVTGLENSSAYLPPFVSEAFCGTYAAIVIQSGTDPSGNGINSGDYITFYTPSWNGTNWTGSQPYHLWFDVDSQGNEPPVSPLVVAEIRSDYAGYQICGAVVNAINSAFGFYFSAVAFVVLDPKIMHLTNTMAGAVTGPATTNGNITIDGLQDGTSSDLQHTDPAFNNGSLILLNTPSTNYFLNFFTGGFGTNLTIAGRTRINVSNSFGNTATQVATAIKAAINGGAVGKMTATSVGAVVTVTNVANGNVTDSSKQQIGSGMPVVTTQQGAP